VLALFSTHILDVFIGLILRVDHQRPATRFINDDAIFNGGSVFRQPRYVPLLDFNVVAQEVSHGDVLRMLY
jgi:hypothetical protein